MSPQLVLLVAAPLVFALLVRGLRDPLRTLLPAYAALVPFGSGLVLPIGLPSPYRSVSTLIGLALVLGLLIRLVRGDNSLTRMPAQVPVWLLFLGLAGTSAYWSLNKQVTADGFFVLASLISLFVLLALARPDPIATRRAELALLLGGVVAACYGFTQFIVGALPTSEQSGPRFGRDLLGANHTAAALLLPLAIALGRATTSSSRRGRLASIGAALLLLAAILLSGSRGALIAAALTFLVLMLHGPRRRGLLFGLALVIVLGVGVVLTATPGGVGARQTREDSSGRSEIWRVGLASCEAHCLTGSGWGTFSKVYADTQVSVPDAKVLRRGTFYEPHNIWLLVGIETGLLGLVLVAIGLGLAVRGAIRLPRQVRGPPLAALLGTLLTAVFLSNLEFKYFWMAIAFVTLTGHAQGVPPSAGLTARPAPASAARPAASRADLTPTPSLH
jgi:O-antigen ligase